MMYEKREPVPQAAQTTSFDRITTPGQITATGIDTGVLTTAAPTISAFTTITSIRVTTITQPGTIVTSTVTVAIPITDAASYSALKASEAAKTATSSAPAATSSAAHKSDGEKSNLGTLIPAIVGPVAGVLIISFVLFWYFMRRRSRKNIDEQPEFAMKEKPLSRESSFKSGTSSTQGLVPNIKVEKTPTITHTEIERGSLDLFPAPVINSEIGVARPMTPPTRGSPPHSRNTSLTGSKANVPNFSGPQPNRARSRSSSNLVPSPSGVGLSFSNFNNSKTSLNDNRGPDRGPHPRGPGQRPGPPPGSVVGPGPGTGFRPSTGPRQPPPAALGPRGSPPRADRPSQPHPRGPGPMMRDPAQNTASPMKPTIKTANRAPPPAALNPPTPTGAFNGASPISQYSPIVKDHPITYDNPPLPQAVQQLKSTSDPRPANSSQNSRALPPPAINTGFRSDSPTYENVLSGEHLTIARLANSSRLGFNSPLDSPRGASPAPGTPPATAARSPELPPPVSRSEATLKPFSSSKPNFSTPHLGNHSPTIPSSAALSDQKAGDRASVVSRVSTEDGYEDIEVDDAKSDVSSLDERERWQLETDIQKKNNASLGMSLTNLSHHGSSTKVANGNTNFRDRDSEGPFVLSRTLHIFSTQPIENYQQGCRTYNPQNVQIRYNDTQK